ncbi:MAG: hypothetical protein WED34_19875 [Planctomycetales bacterium]
MYVSARAYAVWHTAEAIIAYMEQHDDMWPTNWEDLRPYARTGPNTFEELQERVGIDWNANPEELAKATPLAGKPPFRVIWLKDGTGIHYEGMEPNQMILEYLQQRKQSPGER